MGNPGNVYLKCFTELVEKSVSVKSKVRGRSSFSFDSTGGHNKVSSLVNTLKGIYLIITAMITAKCFLIYSFKNHKTDSVITE